MPRISKLEVKTQVELIKEFNRQYKFIVKNFEILLNNPQTVLREYDKLEKSLEDDTKLSMENFWEAMEVYNIVNIITKNAKKQVNRGYTATFKVFKKEAVELGIDFNLENKYAVDYLEALETLYLSNYKGSVTLTTKTKIIDIIRDGIIEQKTPKEIGEEISKLNNNIFATSRAELIATREIGKANEIGSRSVVEQFIEKGARIQKRWLTVNDDRVGPLHTQNQNDGWIAINQTFSGTGDYIAPANDNPRCRCTVTYRVL